MPPPSWRSPGPPTTWVSVRADGARRHMDWGSVWGPRAYSDVRSGAPEGDLDATTCTPSGSPDGDAVSRAYRGEIHSYPAIGIAFHHLLNVKTSLLPVGPRLINAGSKHLFFLGSDVTIEFVIPLDS